MSREADGQNIEERLRAFEAAVFTNTPALLRAATRICRSSSEADDIVQETMLRAWKYWDTFEQGTNCRAWLFRIMVNIIHRRRDGLEAGSEHVSMEEPGIGNVVRMEPRLELDEYGVMAAVERLPAEYREVLVLVLIEEFAYREVAAMLDIPLGTVMSRLHRARQMVKKMIRPQGSSIAM